MIKVVIGFFLSYIYWYMLPEILTEQTLLVTSDFKIRLNKFKAEHIEIWDYGQWTATKAVGGNLSQNKTKK